MSTSHDRASTSWRRRGRRAGIIFFSLVVSTFTLVCTVQILDQVFFAPGTSSTHEPAAQLDCNAALRGLRAAVVRARDGVLHSALAEPAAVSKFREGLRPEWQARPELDRLCNTQQSLAALQLLDELRYAEEHAVRYEAGRLHAVNEDIERLLHPEQH